MHVDADVGIILLQPAPRLLHRGSNFLLLVIILGSMIGFLA